MNTHARTATPLSTQDTTRIDDLRISAVRPLITPALLQEWLPTPESIQTRVAASRAEISRVLHGADDRLVGEDEPGEDAGTRGRAPGPCARCPRGRSPRQGHTMSHAIRIGTRLFLALVASLVPILMN